MTKRYLAITGGCGYIGLRLARSLLRIDETNQVILIDIHPPTFDTNERLIYRFCDIRSYESVSIALENVKCVFHLASYGMSGREMLNHALIEQVNIQGTKNIIDVCRKYQIEKIIYCSTYNAIYTGEKQLIHVTEEQCSYPTDDKYSDEYSRTKSLAEQMIIQANSTTLSTAAIRPAAIYGDGELRHLPRILNLVRCGLAFFAIGHENVLCDWVYADNLVHALILAERSLPKYAGEVYFISDDCPVNNFQFLSKLTTGLGYGKCFYFYIPTIVMFYVGYFIEIIYRFRQFSPLLTRAEVLKVGVTHYANITKAKQFLGYKIQVEPDEAMRICIQWFAEHGYRNKQTKTDNCRLLLFIIVLFLMIVIVLVLFFQRINIQ